jgi:YegS/Rv2252/BmrU family lipid kinase
MNGVKVDVIINANSGADDKEDMQRRLHEMFTTSGVDARMLLAPTGTDVIHLAQQAARSDADTIVAAGGDGTISSVASAVVHSNKTLGILPFGTMNHFAKDLHIPMEPEGALKTIIEGRSVRIDVGEVNGRVFINNSSLGLYPSIVREREKQQRLGRGKWPAFVLAALAVLRRYPFLDVRLTVDGKELTTRTPFVFVGNNEYEMETLDIGGRAALDTGVLSLYVTNRTGRLGLIRLALRALFGGLRQERDFLRLTTEEVWIETKHKRLRVALDGEVTVMEPPLHYRIRKQALRVIVPEVEQTR